MVGTERRSLESVHQNVREIIPTLGFLKPLGRHASGYRTKHLMIWYREQRKRGSSNANSFLHLLKVNPLILEAHLLWGNHY